MVTSFFTPCSPILSANSPKNDPAEPGEHLYNVPASSGGRAAAVWGEKQGGDTRREEVLSKVLVDISIHTTSHASDTAQNKLCSFWMGPVLLWSVIN